MGEARLVYLPAPTQATRTDKYNVPLMYGRATHVRDQSSVGPLTCNLINPASQLVSHGYNTPLTPWPKPRTRSLTDPGNVQMTGGGGNADRMSGEKIRQWLLSVQMFWDHHSAYPTITR